MVSGDLRRRQTSHASSSFYGASLGSLVVLEPRLASPGHPARPDPPLVAPRDHRHLRPLPRHLGLDLLARPEVLLRSNVAR